jgi:hypothetical protein
MTERKISDLQKGYVPAPPKEQAGYQGPTGQQTKPPTGGSAVKPPPGGSK